MQKNCSCHFLYGSGTSEPVTQSVEKALESKEEYQAEVQFYKKNGNNTVGLLSCITCTASSSQFNTGDQNKSGVDCV